MITFNDILRLGGVDPAGVKMLRHTVKGKQILELWRSNRALVEAYQSGQRAGFFDAATHAACFLVSRTGTEVFGGLYRVGTSEPAPADHLDPITGDPNEGTRTLFELTPESAFAEYEDRLVVQWFLAGKHPGWWQWAERNPKPIVEIATQQDHPFPGWLGFRASVDELDLLPSSWREVLRSTSGVYLLTDVTGTHYVGSAKGGDGLLGRWAAYRNGGTGGNVDLANAVGPFTATVLQTFDPALSDDTVERIESQWKDKLGTRAWGFNRN